MKRYAKEEAALLRLIGVRPPEVLAVDLDGTVAVFNKWHGYFSIGKPVVRVVRWLRGKKKSGAYIIIHTCRISLANNKIFPASLKNLKAWLKKNRVPYDEIWVSRGKPGASVYLDDHGYRIGCKTCEHALGLGR